MTGPERRGADLLLATATLAALAVVPDWPHRHVSDPSYWGVVGFVVLVVALLGRRRGAFRPGGASRRTVVVFLLLVPVVYVADGLRFGATSPELGIQAAGLAIWIVLAILARRSDTVLWLGCVLHALWDAAHFGRADFVPEWYAAACLAADVGLGAFVLLRTTPPTGRGDAEGPSDPSEPGAPP